MAGTKCSTKKVVPLHSWAGVYGAFIRRVRQLGCEFCPVCYAYVVPDGHEHAAALRKAA